MNASRVAQLLRELAKALEEGEPANDETPPTAPVTKPSPKRPRTPYRPPPDVTDIDRARADRALRARGYIVQTGGKR